MNLFSSQLSGWDTDLQDIESAPYTDNNKKMLGFNCMIPFTKLEHQSEILFDFFTKKNITVSLCIVGEGKQILIEKEQSFNFGTHNIQLNIENLEPAFYFLHIKSIGKFKVSAIKIN